MNEKQMVRFGKIFKALRMEVVSKIYTPKDNIRVSMVHYVKPEDMENFNSIIGYLKSIRKIISPDEFFRCYTSGSDSSIRGRLLLITFDDGLYSNYCAAKTILSKYDIKAIFFIPTKIFELKNKEEMRAFAYKNLYLEKYPLESLTEAEYITMTRDNVMELRRQGHWVLPHTHSHRSISDITSEDSAYAELVKPKLIIEELLKEEINAFAFSMGTERDISAFSYRRIMPIYKFSFSALSGANHSKTDRHYFHRDCIHAHYPLPHVKNIIDGVFDPYYLIKMRKLKSKVEGKKTKWQ
jgi:peptidoglycan/xylan/chitin deacetylase (PgdA/CDA1 family)